MAKVCGACDTYHRDNEGCPPTQEELHAILDRVDDALAEAKEILKYYAHDRWPDFNQRAKKWLEKFGDL